ncbi:MAG TPA: DNA translocase FtsK, partial [Sphaerochaeta sp.]|nr:DNA translocase FtsK [Sphaerochaeta sp.]
MKKKTNKYIVAGGVVLLILGLLLGFALAATQLGKAPQFVGKGLALLSKGVGFFASDSPLALLPFVGMLFLWSGMCFTFRNKRKFSLVFIPLSALMFYTLLVLSYMLQGSPRPQFLQPLLYAFDAEPRLASLRVVVLFLLEMGLFVTLTLIGDGLDRRQQRREAFQALLDRANSGEHVDLGSLSLWQRRSFKRAQKRFAKAQDTGADEEESVLLHKKPVEPQVDILSDDRLSFPPIVEVPTLSNLHKKRDRKPKGDHILDVEEHPTSDVGIVSVGALDTIRGELDRNKGLSYLEMKQRELHEKREAEDRARKEEITKEKLEPAERKQEPAEEKKTLGKLSGFLQGALEAVGKGPSTPVEPRPEPTGKARGMLADAVASKEKRSGLEAVALGVKMPQDRDDDQPLRIRERILSVRPPRFEKESVVEEQPPVAQGISPFAPQSTARPINGGSSEDAPVPVELSDEEDALEVASGVGGLVGSEGPSSALINRNRITYQYPPESILVTYPKIGNEINEETLERGRILVATLEQFNVHVELTNIVRGPTVTMLEILPAPGVRVNAIVNLADNIAMALAAKQVRI